MLPAAEPRKHCGWDYWARAPLLPSRLGLTAGTTDSRARTSSRPLLPGEPRDNLQLTGKRTESSSLQQSHLHRVCQCDPSEEPARSSGPAWHSYPNPQRMKAILIIQLKLLLVYLVQVFGRVHNPLSSQFQASIVTYSLWDYMLVMTWVA